MPDDTPKPVPPPRRRPRSRRYKWTMRVLVAVVTLAIVVVVVVQLVLGSAIPTQIVIAQVQKTLGLRITTAKLTTGWLGHATLKDVTLSLPLAEHAFLEVPEMRVDHTILPILILTQSADLNSIELDRPRIHVTQDKFGRWNLQDVADLLARVDGKGQTQQAAPNKSPITFPKLKIRDGQIDISDNSGRQANLMPLNVTGEPVNSLVWQYDASLDTAEAFHVKLTGRLAPNDNFTHEAEFALSGLAPIVRPWIQTFDPKASVDGHWRGAATSDGVAGRLQIHSFHYKGISADQADVNVQASPGSVAITPRQLIIQTPVAAMRSVAVAGGSIAIDAMGAKVNQLELSTMDGRLRIDGGFTVADQSGVLHGQWETLRPAPGVISSGKIEATLRRDWPDQRVISVNVTTSGTAAGAAYDAVVNLSGGGKTLDSADWTLAAPRLVWSGKQPLSLNNLTAHLVTHPGEILLTDMGLRNSNDLTARGGLRFDPQRPGADHYDWWLYALGQNWPIPQAEGATLAFDFNAWGNQEQIRLEEGHAISGQLIASAAGYYYLSRPKPVDLVVNVSELPAAVASDSFVTGRVRGEAELLGTLFPLSLEASGQLHGEQLVVDNRPLQQLDVKCRGTLDDDHAALDTEELSLLGGEWALHARFPSPAAGHGRAPEIMVKVHDLPLASVGDLLREQSIAGIVNGTISLDIDRPHLDQISGVGHFTASDVRARDFRADTFSTDVSLHDGIIELSPIQLHLGAGHAEAKLSTRIDHPKLISASVSAADWPVDAGNLHARVSAEVKQLVIDVNNRLATGEVHFGAAVKLRDQPLVTADGALAVAGRKLNLEALHASGLSGSATGSASLDLDSPLASRGTITFQGLNLSALTAYGDQYQDARGLVSGEAVLAPANDPRALGPLKLNVDLQGQDSHFRNLGVREAHLPVYFDRDRAVLDAGRIDIAGGSIELFARLSRHVEGAISTQLQASLNSLDLEPLLHALDQSDADKTKAYPGRVDGMITLVGDPRNKEEFFGQASLGVHDSDLVNFGPFAVLYDTMHLGGNPGKPIGRGSLEFRYDNDSLVISSLRYFNRGVDAYGLLTASRISQYPRCPLDGTLVGTLRPLKDIKLPFFADADQIFSALQSNLTPILIGGTKEKPTYVPESAAAVTNAMRGFLLGDVPKGK